MANHKDAEKRARQSEVRRIRNRTYRTRMRNQIKKIRGMMKGSDSATLQAELSESVSVIQHLAAKGVIHRNQAARRVKRLAAAVKAASAK